MKQSLGMLLACLACAALPLHGQTATATLQGIVDDSSAETVPGGRVILKDVANGPLRKKLQ